MGWFAYLLLLLLCSLGHALIWVWVINWSHGVRSQQGLIEIMRVGLHVILSGSPLLFILLTWQTVPDQGWYALPIWLHPYLLLTAGLGGIVFPVLVLAHWLKRPPSALLKEEQEIFKVREYLGSQPTGSGRLGWFARLPWNQAYEVDLVEKEILVPRLPACWDGLRILHLSDLHLWGRPGRAFFETVLARCSKRPCDLLVFTGDLIDSDEHYEWLRLLKTIPWSQAAFAIRGNHDVRFDADRVTSELEQLGIQVIGGQARLVTIRDKPVLVTGNEAPWLLPIPNLRPYEGLDCFRLALIHTPDQFRWAKEQGIDLVLAGHTHGGQIRCPGFGSIFVPCKMGRRYDMGLFQEGGTLLHVSRGLSGTMPVRYFCRPEVTWLILRSPNG